MKSTILSILFVLCFFVFGADICVAQSTSSTTSSTLPGTGSTIDPVTLLKVLKLAAKALKVNADLLVAEYQAGNCTVCCLDPKAGVYKVEYGGVVIILTTGSL